MKSKKDKILNTYKLRIEDQLNNGQSQDQLIDKQTSVLLGELQIAQLELEMQNDEISMAAQLLEVERAKFEGFFNLAPIGYFILDHLGQVREANQVGLKLLNVSKQKLQGQRLQSFIVPTYFELFYSFLHSLQPNGNKNSAMIKLSTTEGREVYTRMEGIALDDSFTGKLQYYVTVLDITESRIAEQELKDTTQRLELTLKASGIGTWSVNMDTNRLFLDQYSLSLLGINPWEFSGSINDFFDLVHAEDQHVVRQTLLSAYNNVNNIELEFRIVTKNAVKNISVKGHQVEITDANTHIAGILIDVTKKKQIEEAQQELKNEKQKLIFAATFDAQEKERERISSALHDSVCQLLYGIRLNLQNIQLKQQTKSDFKSVNELITKAIKETREISYELIPSVLRDFGFIAGVGEIVQRFSNKQFQITTQISDSVNQLDKELQLSLFRMIQELLNNCIKHAKASKADIILCTANNEVTLVVSDNGKGFGPEKEIALASGSGLRSIKNRVFLLNGSFEIASGENGTKVCIQFKFNK
jgi:PAS domain S-box-containing protein